MMSRRGAQPERDYFLSPILLASASNQYVGELSSDEAMLDGRNSAVHRFADAMGGEVLIPHERNLTALVGQAVMIIDDEHAWNVDVIFQVFGSDARAVMRVAPGAELEA